MKSRLIVPRFLVTAGITLALWAVGAGRASAQVTCNPDVDPNCVCAPAPFEEGQVCRTAGENVMCPDPTPEGSACAAPFKGNADTWNFVFGAINPNNAIKVGTDVMCTEGFVLVVQAFTIKQEEYAARRTDEFADTVCNPTADPLSTNCVFYRVHGENVPRGCYGATVEYKVFWNTPPIQGNKHDWMLLRAPCSEFGPTVFPPSVGDPNVCDGTQKFSENITLFVDRRPPVGTDPVVGGDADGMSDYIVAISTKHPHKGIPSMPF
jgi:hypothetical protein